MSDLPIAECYWVVPDRLLAGERPSHDDEELSRARLSAFLEAGVTDFIDLTDPREFPPYEPLLQELAAQRGMKVRYARLTIGDYGLPSRERMQEILDEIDAALNKNRKVYVHCWGGVGRTGTVVGCFLVRRGETPKNALAQVNQLFRSRPTSAFHPRSPETDEQAQFVLEWRESPRYCEG